MIGFLMGTCTAFFVVMGDLAPPIVGNILGIAPSANLRLVILMGETMVIILIYLYTARYPNFKLIPFTT